MILLDEGKDDKNIIDILTEEYKLFSRKSSFNIGYCEEAEKISISFR